MTASRVEPLDSYAVAPSPPSPFAEGVNAGPCRHGVVSLLCQSVAPKSRSLLRSGGGLLPWSRKLSAHVPTFESSIFRT